MATLRVSLAVRAVAAPGPHPLLLDKVASWCDCAERRAQGLQSAAQLRLLLANSAAARKLLMQHNYRLVISGAKRYIGRGVETADLVQEVSAP